VDEIALLDKHDVARRG